MDSYILDTVDYVMQYAAGSTNWLAVKKEILWMIPVPYRKLFSRRHYSTKKHSINDFEKDIIAYWYENTGDVLVIPEDKIHNAQWVRHRSGWGLKKFNKERTARLRRERKHEQK